MKIFICIIFITCFLQASYSQNEAFADSIDLLIKSAKKGNRILHDNDTAAKRHYYFNKRKQQFVTIVYLPLQKTASYEYCYMNGELIKLRILLSYTLHPESIGKPMVAAYYFRNGRLEHKKEANFPATDIEFYRKLGLQLFERAEQFAKR